MARISYWCHYSKDSRSAAGQRLKMFERELTKGGHEVVLLGQGFESKKNALRRIWSEVFGALFCFSDLHIITVPPYKSAIYQTLCMIFMFWKKLIVDQRDLALSGASALEKFIETILVRRADLIIVTTISQKIALEQRYKLKEKIFVIRNGASPDIIPSTCQRPANHCGSNRLKVFYQGLVGGKGLKEISALLSSLGTDLYLSLFVDQWSVNEVDEIKNAWKGDGKLKIFSNSNAEQLIEIMSHCHVALNPVPKDMEYAFTLKTADYVVNELPQIVIGSRKSVSRRVVELFSLGTGVLDISSLTKDDLFLAISTYNNKKLVKRSSFYRTNYSSRILSAVSKVL